MGDLRDWSRTLSQASYKGVPFFVDESAEEGGRNPVVHVFPNRDEPYIEDLGEEPRTFTVAAYVHGNDADRQALALKDALRSRGRGLLVLPVRGPVMVQALPFKRRDEKDRLGYVAFELKFMRDGAATAIVSLPSLLNDAFGAVDGLQTAAAAAFGRMVNVTGVPDFIASAAYDGLASGAAALDVARSTNTVDVVTSARMRDALASVVAGADRGDDIGSIGADLFTAARTLADGMSPDIAIGAMSGTIDAFTP